MSLLDPLRVLLLLAGLILPGTGWALAFRWPLPWFAGGVISALSIFAGVLLFSCVSVPVNLLSLTLWLTVGGGIGWVFWWFHRRRSPAISRPVQRIEWWLIIPLLPMLAVSIWRACCQPLSGADTVFRWNSLAELIVEKGGLAGYPPLSPSDFMDYFWADGIAPLVSSVYAWAYLCGGSLGEIWTAVPVMLQMAGLLAVLAALGNHWQPGRGGWFACAVGAGTMLLQFSFELGQETGLTALGAGGMIFYVLRWKEEEGISLLVPAALCAALAACAREYGVIAALTATFAIVALSESWRPTVLFIAVAAILPLCWHLRVFILTGNPIYAQSFLGFRSNPVFDALMNLYRESYGDPLWQGGGWLEIARRLAVYAFPATAGLLVGALRFRETRGWGLMLLTAGWFGALWIISIPYTGGGIFYSMRVLSPVFVIGCAWGGACLAAWVPGRKYLTGVLIALTLYSLDASLRAWTIPSNPYSIPPQEWPTAGYQLQREFLANDDRFIKEMVTVVDGRVLSDSAGLRRYFQKVGKSYSPFWSPDVAWLFSGKAPADAAARLRAQGFSHVLLKRSAITQEFLLRTGMWQALNGRLKPVMGNSTFVLFEVDGAAPVNP